MPGMMRGINGVCQKSARQTSPVHMSRNLATQRSPSALEFYLRWYTNGPPSLRHHAGRDKRPPVATLSSQEPQTEG